MPPPETGPAGMGPPDAPRIEDASTLRASGGGIVRHARRPLGWTAPGPRPAFFASATVASGTVASGTVASGTVASGTVASGTVASGGQTPGQAPGSPASRSPSAFAPGLRPELWPGADEDLCYLTGDWRILQKLVGHRWSLDDLVTAWFACALPHPLKIQRALDLGCGIGSVLMMVAWRFPEVRSVGLEAQEVSAGLAKRSLAWNGIEDRCQVVIGDLRDPEALAREAPFDLVTGTPPYFLFGRGRISSRVQCGPCRFEYRGGIEEYCRAAARFLAPHGRFTVCESFEQGARVAAGAQAAGLAIRQRLDVIPREGKAPLISVFAMEHHDAGPWLREPVQVTRLTVRGLDGQWTKEFATVRLEMGLPPVPRGTSKEIRCATSST